MSNLVEHAERELKAAGLLSKDSDYDGMVGKAVLDLVKVFSEQGHSGGSASYVLYVFSQVANYQALTELTDDPAEWFHHDADMSTNGKEFWQNIRNSEAFSNDGGKTYYLLSEGANAQNPSPIHESKQHNA